MTPLPSKPSAEHRVRGDRGASVVEYALLVALIAMVCISAVAFFGSQDAGSLTRTADSVGTATN